MPSGNQTKLPDPKSPLLVRKVPLNTNMPCAQSWVTDPETYEELQESPYVLAGQGPWAPGFEAALRTVLTAAAGTGG